MQTVFRSCACLEPRGSVLLEVFRHRKPQSGLVLTTDMTRRMAGHMPRSGGRRQSWWTPLSMCHEHRQICMFHDVTGGAAKYHLS